MRHRRVHRRTRWCFASTGALALAPLVAALVCLSPDRAPSRAAALEPVPPARTSLPPRPVPLDDVLTTDTHNWGDVPYGTLACDDIPFLCPGAIRLAGLRSAREAKRYPGAVWGVPVQRQGRRIHLLQAAENWTGTARGTPYGKVALHYANGEDRSMYLLFGVHGLDWYGGSQTPNEAVADPNTKLCWAFQKPDGSYRRFFHTVFTNPLPEVEITAADFVSPLGTPNLWVFGFTLSDEPAPLSSQPAQASLATPRAFVTIRLQDAAGRSITNGAVAWQVIGSNYRVEFPPCPADALGRVVLDLPRVLVANISYSATSATGLRAGGLIERAGARGFPKEVVVKFGAREATGNGPARLAPAPPERSSPFRTIDLRPQSGQLLDASKTNQ